MWGEYSEYHGFVVPRSRERGGTSVEAGEEVEEGEEEEMEEEEGEDGEEEEEPSGISWAPRVSAKRKAREDFWIDAELEVRRICGYKERRSKKVIERIKERELRETRDIRGMFSVEERGGTSSEGAGHVGRARQGACPAGDG